MVRSDTHSPAAFAASVPATGARFAPGRLGTERAKVGVQTLARVSSEIV